MGRMKEKDIAKLDEMAMQAFESFMAEQESSTVLTEADLTDEDFECACELCAGGWRS